MKTIALIGCSKTKLAHRATARALYTSPLFKLSVLYAKEVAKVDAWWILSAKHGLVAPTRWLEPYELSLADRSARERDAMPRALADDLGFTYPEGARFLWLCGSLYLGAVSHLREPNKFEHEEPMRGMQIGERLRWLRREIESPKGAKT